MTPCRTFLTLALLAPSASLAHADIVWTGAAGDDIFDEGNWDFTNSTVTAVDPNVSIDDDVVIRNAPGTVKIPDLAGQQRFQLGDGFKLTLDDSTLIAANNDGVGCAPLPVMGADVLVVNGALFAPFFVVNDTRVDIDATSEASFGGPNNPINLSTVNITVGSVLRFPGETPADYIAEHLSKTTVDGAPAVVGANLAVVSDGALGCVVTAIPQTIGTNYCSAATNSAGLTGQLSGEGSRVAADDDVTLTASQLPPGQFGIFIASRTQGFVPGAGGQSNGNLCVGGSIGRFFMQSQIRPTGANGRFSLRIPLTMVPQGAGFVAVQPGDTWNFQAWHREGVGAGSNFTNGLSIDFL